MKKIMIMLAVFFFLAVAKGPEAVRSILKKSAIFVGLKPTEEKAGLVDAFKLLSERNTYCPTYAETGGCAYSCKVTASAANAKHCGVT